MRWSELYYFARIRALSQANVEQLVTYFLLFFMLRLDRRIVLIHPGKNHFIICYKQLRQNSPVNVPQIEDFMLQTFSPAYYSMFSKSEDV